MIETLKKPWNDLPAGTELTLDADESDATGAVLIGEKRHAFLVAEGFLDDPETRMIPVEHGEQKGGA